MDEKAKPLLLACSAANLAGAYSLLASPPGRSRQEFLNCRKEFALHGGEAKAPPQGFLAAR